MSTVNAVYNANNTVLNGDLNDPIQAGRDANEASKTSNQFGIAQMRGGGVK